MKNKAADKPMKHLGEVIRKWRLMSEITVRDAARMIGVNPSVLCRLEAGDNVDGFTLTKVLQWLLATSPLRS